MLISGSIIYFIIGLFGLFFGIPIFFFLYKKIGLPFKISGIGGIAAIVMVSFFFHSLLSNVIIVADNSASRYYIYDEVDFEMKDGSMVQIPIIEDGEFIINNEDFACVIERSDYRDYDTNEEDHLSGNLILLPSMSSYLFPAEDIDYLFSHAPNSIKTGRKKYKRKLIRFELRALTIEDRDEGEFHIYNGPVIAGTPNGEGMIRYDSLSSYKGSFENGRLQGKGIEVYSNGEYYSGDFEQDKREGYGEFLFVDSSFYKGDWFAGKMEGIGIMMYANGDSYEGGFIQNEASGEGELSKANGGGYVGSFLKGKYNGQGILISSSGKKTEGFWVDGKLN
ncbi:MAG: hypothetical protein ACI8ZM_004308 [Crocinitomix sp.]|jgi:hypothetical protein